MFRVSVGNGNEVAPEEIAISFDDVKVRLFLFLRPSSNVPVHGTLWSIQSTFCQL